MSKIELIEKLIKEGKITFTEALILNEKEYVFPEVSIPSQWTPDWTYRPNINPWEGIYYTTSGTAVTDSNPKAFK